MKTFNLFTEREIKSILDNARKICQKLVIDKDVNKIKALKRNSLKFEWISGKCTNTIIVSIHNNDLVYFPFKIDDFAFNIDGKSEVYNGKIIKIISGNVIYNIKVESDFDKKVIKEFNKIINKLCK
jgi:hypothetical protein